MKKLSFIIFTLVVIAMTAAFFGGYLQNSHAQQPVVSLEPSQEAPQETPSPTLEDYEQFLEKMDKMAKNFMVLDSWKEMTFKHKKTDKVVEWKDLSEYEKTMFCLVMAERTTAYFTRMNAFWQEELKAFDRPNHKLVPTPDPQNDKQKAATKEDVKKYLERLTEIRKKFASEYEKFAEDSFKKYEKEVSVSERDKMLKSIKEYHDKNKLVERK